MTFTCESHKAIWLKNTLNSLGYVLFSDNDFFFLVYFYFYLLIINYLSAILAFVPFMGNSTVLPPDQYFR